MPSTAKASPPKKLQAIYHPSVTPKERGTAFDKTRTRSPIMDQPSKPVLSVVPAFRLIPEKSRYTPLPALAAPAPAMRPMTASHTAFLRSRSGLGGTIGSVAGSLTASLRVGGFVGAVAPSEAPVGLGALAASLRATTTAASAAAAAAAGGGGGAAGEQPLRLGPARPPSRLGVWGPGPTPADPFRARHNPANSELRFALERGDLPVSILHGARMRLAWKAPVAELDLSYYLPLFASGLRELEFPYSFIAEEGFGALLECATPERVAALVPMLVMPLRAAINTRAAQPMVRTLAALKKLASLGGEGILAGTEPPHATAVGAALLPFYRQLLPTLNLYAQKALNLGDGIDYGQRFNRSMGEAIAEVLRVLDLTGGEAAYLNIAYSVPTYVRAVA
jgi:hypothetical protein